MCHYINSRQTNCRQWLTVKLVFTLSFSCLFMITILYAPLHWDFVFRLVCLLKTEQQLCIFNYPCHHFLTLAFGPQNLAMTSIDLAIWDPSSTHRALDLVCFGHIQVNHWCSYDRQDILACHTVRPLHWSGCHMIAIWSPPNFSDKQI